MKKIALYISIIILFTNCTKESDGSYTPTDPTEHTHYYTADEVTITASQIGDGTGKLNPKGIAIANNKLYVCNGDVLEIFNATTLKYIKTISNYTKGTTTIALTNLSSVSIDNNRIYVGSLDSRVFVFDESTTAGISTVGNGHWSNTFVHVFGLVVKDGLVFVKEKETTIKIFETSQITERSDWNLKPIAMLNTLNGFDQIYSMDVQGGNLVVAGRDAQSYLYYNIADIKANAENSLTTPITPETMPFKNEKPIAISFSNEWAISSEFIENLNFLRIYPIEEFTNKTYNATINIYDVLQKAPFGTILSTAFFNDHIFMADNTNHQIRIIKLHKGTIVEQN